MTSIFEGAYSNFE